MIYGFAASVLPVWLLLAPRDYLSTFMKLGTVAVLGGVHRALRPAAAHAGGDEVHRRHRPRSFPGPVFPFVCITIACGAISGFHSLISSGTTPKLLRAGAAYPPGRLRRDDHGDARRADGDHRRLRAPARPVFRDQPPDRPEATPRRSPPQIAKINAGSGFPVTLAGMQTAGRRTSASRHDRRDRRRADLRRGHGADVCEGVRRGRGCWRSGTTSRSCSRRCSSSPRSTPARASGRFILQDLLGNVWTPLARHAIVDRQRPRQRPARRGVGLLPLSGRDRSRRHRQEPVADLRHRQPAARRDRLLPRHHGPHQDGTDPLHRGDTRSARRAEHRDVLGRLDENFLPAAAGFLPAIRKLEGQLAAGGAPANVEMWQRQLFNARLDTALTAMFLIFVAVIVAGSALEWWRLVQGRKPLVLRESQFVALPEET